MPSKDHLVKEKKSKTGSTKKKKIVRRRKPATKSVTGARKKSAASGGSKDSSIDVTFVPKGKGHSRDRKSSVEVDAPSEVPPPEGPPSVMSSSHGDETDVNQTRREKEESAVTADASTAASAAPLNVLRVDILSCYDLREADGAGKKSDPYVRVKIGKKKGRTRTVKKHLHPVFNERFEFAVEAPASSLLNIEVYDKDMMSDDRLGQIEPLDLNALPALRAGRREKMVLPLVGKYAKAGSTATIALEWYFSAAIGKKQKTKAGTVKPIPVPEAEAEAEPKAKAETKPTLKAGLSDSSDEWDGDDLRNNTNPFADMVGDPGIANVSGTSKSQGRILAEALFLLLDADHSDKLEKKEFRTQLRSKEDHPAVQALYASTGIVDHHASGNQVKKLFDVIDDHHMTMDADGKRYIDLAELTAFCEKHGAHMASQ